MTHNYSEVTKSDNTYIAVSDVRPIGTVEDKLTWAIINTAYDTWIELLDYGRVHWCDWYYGTPYTDNYSSITTPSATYQGVTV
jgi:hypothetical protein